MNSKGNGLAGKTAMTVKGTMKKYNDRDPRGVQRSPNTHTARTFDLLHPSTRQGSFDDALV